MCIVRIMKEINPIDLKFKHPTTCLISGCTQSGKTFKTLQIIEDWKIQFAINKNSFNVLWFYSQFQEKYQTVNSSTLVLNFVNGKPSDEIIEEFKPDLIVLDDLMDELKNDPILNKFFTQTCHHKGITVFFIVQNLFLQGNFMRTVSLNTHYFLIMDSPRAIKQLEYFSRQIKKKSSNEDAEKIFERAKSNRKYGYLLIDLHPTTPYRLRYRSRITSFEVPEELKLPGFKFAAPIIHQP